MEFYGESFDASEPEILVNYEEDTYQQFTEEDYDYDDFLMKNGPVFSPYSFDEILENCIIPTATDALKELLPVVFWCIVFRILTQSFTTVPPWLKHSTSVIYGTIIAFQCISWSIKYLFGLTLMSYLILGFSHNYVQFSRGPLSFVVCLSFNMIW